MEKQEKLQFELVKEINSKFEVLTREKENLKAKFEELKLYHEQVGISDIPIRPTSIKALRK